MSILCHISFSWATIQTFSSESTNFEVIVKYGVATPWLVK